LEYLKQTEDFPITLSSSLVYDSKDFLLNFDHSTKTQPLPELFIFPIPEIKKSVMLSI